jgi:hypothetical protein
VAHSRENVSQFVTAAKTAPINLHDHDAFVTVDLVESRDLVQVLQCIAAFSRAAHRLRPSTFPIQIGGSSRRGAMSPQGTGTSTAGRASVGERPRGTSNASNTSSAYTYARPVGSSTPARTGELNGGWSPTKATGGAVFPNSVGATSLGWNPVQYGYIGGANQGSLGVAFGAHRQITSAGPHIPNMAEKAKARREKQEEEERIRAESERLRRVEQEAEAERVRAEEERARVEEDERWAEEERKIREQKRLKVEEEKRQWEDQERTWKLEEQRRKKEEQEAEAALEEERRRARGTNDARLRGQFLSQYQAENNTSKDDSREAENSRIKELERELEQAREREREYEREKQARLNVHSRQDAGNHDTPVWMKEEKTRSRSRSRPRAPSRKNSGEIRRQDERDYLQQQWSAHHNNEQFDTAPLPKSPRPLPEPTPAVRVKTNHTGPSSRPLPDPAQYASPKEPQRSFQANQNRTDHYLSSKPAPEQTKPRTTYSKELGAFDSVGERDAENQRRPTPQPKTTAGNRSQMSIVERAMETERQRQQEWEANLNENQRKLLTSPARGLVGPRPPPR